MAFTKASAIFTVVFAAADAAFMCARLPSCTALALRVLCDALAGANRQQLCRTSLLFTPIIEVRYHGTYRYLFAGRQNCVHKAIIALTQRTHLSLFLIVLVLSPRAAANSRTPRTPSSHIATTLHRTKSTRREGNAGATALSTPSERRQRIARPMDTLKGLAKGQALKVVKKASEEALKNPETRQKIVDHVKKDPAKALKLAKTLSKTLSK